MFLTQKSLYFVVFHPKTTVWPSLGRISVEILMATPRSRQIFRWRRRRRLHFVFFFMLFYSIELIHIHITCLHVYYCLHIPSSLAQDARLCHGRGKDHSILWTILNSRGSLGFHGIRVVHAKGSLEVAEVALPPNASMLLAAACCCLLKRVAQPWTLKGGHRAGFTLSRFYTTFQGPRVSNTFLQAVAAAASKQASRRLESP